MSQIIEEILKFSIPEHILMVQATWDSIEEKDELLELDVETKQFLDERLEDHYNNTKDGSNWADVKSRIRLEH